jgi:hypothetical protein
MAAQQARLSGRREVEEGSGRRNGQERRKRENTTKESKAARGRVHDATGEISTLPPKP